MTENKKDQTAPVNRDGNQNQSTQGDQANNDEQSGPSKKSSGMEEENESTRETKEQEDLKHPHKQGVPVSGEENTNGI